MSSPDEALNLLEDLKKHVEAIERDMMVCDVILPGPFIAVPTSEAIKKAIKDIVYQKYRESKT